MPVQIQVPQKNSTSPLDRAAQLLDIATKLQATGPTLDAAKQELANKIQAGQIQANQIEEQEYKKSLRPAQEKQAEYDSKIKQQKDYLAIAQSRKELNKPPVPTVIENTVDAGLALASMDNVNKAISQKPEQFGKLSSFKSLLGDKVMSSEYTREAQQLASQLDANVQVVGKFLEGGVLKEGDIARYKKMLPSIGDTPELAKFKQQIVSDLVAKKIDLISKGASSKSMDEYLGFANKQIADYQTGAKQLQQNNSSPVQSQIPTEAIAKQNKDPFIEATAKANNISYEHAASILKGRSNGKK